MGYKPSLNRTLNHRFFRESVTLYRGGSTDENADGYADLDLENPVDVSVSITSPQRSPFEVVATGTVDDYSHAMRAPTSRNITGGDRIVYDDGFGAKPYMVVERRSDKFAYDEYSWYLLQDDPRGEESPGDDATNGTGDGTSDPDSDYGY